MDEMMKKEKGKEIYPPLNTPAYWWPNDDDGIILLKTSVKAHSQSYCFITLLYLHVWTTVSNQCFIPLFLCHFVFTIMSNHPFLITRPLSHMSSNSVIHSHSDAPTSPFVSHIATNRQRLGKKMFLRHNLQLSI